jgi:hypothetical protein
MRKKQVVSRKWQEKDFLLCAGFGRGCASSVLFLQALPVSTLKKDAGKACKNRYSLGLA